MERLPNRVGRTLDTLPAGTCLLAGFLLFANPAAASHVVELGTLGGSSSRITKLNNANQICGASTTINDEYDHAFLYSAGSMQDLGTFGGPHSAALDMNDAGQVVGWANAATCHMEIFAGHPVCVPDKHAFFHDGEAMIDLGALAWGPVSEALAVNDAGQVAGYSWVASGTHAFRYSNGVMTDLGTLGGTFSYATDINASGDVVGSSTLASGEVRPFLYSNGVMTNLGTLGGTSAATSINSAGDVLGHFLTAEFENHAFLYRDGTMIDLGKFVPYEDPLFLNDSGQVVLPSDTGGWTRPVMYEDGVYTDIGIVGDIVRGLNSSGEVTGSGSVPTMAPFRESGGVRTDLRSPGDPEGDGVAINEYGRVAGHWIMDSVERGVLFTHACRPQPAESCAAAAKSSLQMKRSDDPAKNRLSWSWSSGAAVLPEDLGQPASTTAYELCVYDSLGGESVLVADLAVLPNASWRDGGSSRTYRDSSGSRDGVRSLQVRSGVEGDTRVRLKAKGVNLPIPVPMLLYQEPRVTVQLFADTTGACWTSEFTDSASNDGDSFKASAP